MTSPTEQSQVDDTKAKEKELNFRALEAKYQRQLDQERAARLEIERQYKEATTKKTVEEEEDSDEPYVDHKRLEKKMATFEKRMEAKIDQKAEEKARMMLEEEKKNTYLRNNPDFYDVLQHAERFAESDPEWADTILKMPEGFERQKLVYKNIKALGMHQPKQPTPSIQDKIDANRRSPYYQPSGTGTAPYNSSGDFSASGQANAYKKMKELQQKLRM